MAQVYRLYPEAVSTIWTCSGTDFSAGDVAVSSVVDNTSGLYTSAVFELKADFPNPVSANTWMHISISKSIDGTNYEDITPSMIQTNIVASLRNNASSNMRWTFMVDGLPACKFKVLISNDGGQEGQNTSTFKMIRYTQEVASA